MKTILIDELVKDQLTTEKVSIIIKDKKFEGWQIAKPLNYKKEYTTFIGRLKMAMKVLKGKAIAVQFFTDLSKEDKIKYVETKLKCELEKDDKCPECKAPLIAQMAGGVKCSVCDYWFCY